ncbi:Tn3 family transposase [Streptomyces avermitilis]|uniref:Tn3 family transposase n=1 Tax=Streptomyces avermitilis TaxID=33903 RepID=UPI00369EA88D
MGVTRPLRALTLFGEPGKNVIDFDLIESQFRHLMRVAVSVREGTVSSSTLLKRLRSGSRKNATYAAFREVGRVIRTVQLLRYLSDAPLRRRVTAATNKVESFNRFSQWIGFGNRGVIADNDPIEQEKAMKFNALLTNAVIFHNALDIAEIVRQLREEGWEIDPEDLAHISPHSPDRAHQPVRRVQHPRTRHPARRVRPETRRRLHPAACTGPDRRWL